MRWMLTKYIVVIISHLYVQVTMQYTLILYRSVYQLYLNKIEKESIGDSVEEFTPNPCHRGDALQLAWRRVDVREGERELQ